MKKSMAVFWGIVLIAVGAVIILTQLDLIQNVTLRWWNLWPAFMILLGIMFHVQFFAGGAKAPGVLVPGGILLVYGGMFMYVTLTSDWGAISYLWPLFLVGPGFGLMELKLFSRGREGSWIPVIILFGLAVAFFLGGNNLDLKMIGAAVLILVGASIIISSIVKRNKGN